LARPVPLWDAEAEYTACRSSHQDQPLSSTIPAVMLEKFEGLLEWCKKPVYRRLAGGIFITLKDQGKLLRSISAVSAGA